MILLGKPWILAFIALLVLSLFGLKDLSKLGFYTNHDGETHTARIAQYYQALKDGQLPPRFANSFYNGLGSPIFVYIYPVPYALGSLIHALGISYVNSFKLLMFLGFFASSLTAYVWLKEVFKSEKAAFLGALFYIWVPYRFSLVFVRASVSELIAYIFVPLTLFILSKLSQKPNLKWTAANAISFSLILLSQNLVALLSIPIIGVYAIILTAKSRSKKYFFLSTASAIWGFAIAQITYLPSQLELKYVRFSENINNTFVDHFVTLKQLIRSPWDYGFDLPGTVNDTLSFQIGLAQILVVGLAIVTVAVMVFRKTKMNTTLFLAIFFLIVFFVCIFLMVPTKPNLYVWQHFKPMLFIDIPWRLLGICALSASFLAAFVAKNIKPGIVFIFLIAFVIFANRNHLRINQSRILDDNYFDKYTGTATQYNEFTPKSRQTTRVPEGFKLEEKIDTIEGDAQVTNLQTNSKKTKFNLDVHSPTSQIRINKFYFPNTRVTQDGKILEVSKDFVVTDANSLDVSTQKDASGLIQLSVAEGFHEITVEYKDTPVRTYANIIFSASLLLALFVILKNAKI